jgi:ribosomal protein L40E
MGFAGKLNAGMYGIAKSVKTGAGNSKLDGRIEEQQKKIKELTKEIGNLTLIRLEAGDVMSPDIMERFDAICQAKTEIETLEKEKVVTTIICPKCGEKTSVGMKYCGKCGALINGEEQSA